MRATRHPCSRIRFSALASWLMIVAVMAVIPAAPAQAAVVCGPSMNVATFTDLNDAVLCFNAETAAGVYTINVNADITYTTALTTIFNATAGVSLDIAGNGNTLNAAANGRVLTNFNSTLSVDNLTITGGNTGSGGGIFNNGGSVTVSNSTITGNTAAVAGGGIDNSTGTTTVSNSTVSGNTATQSGGGISNIVGTVNVWFSTVTGNTAPDGAGLWSFNETFAFTNVGGSIVADNLGAGGDVDYRLGTGTNSFSSDGFNVIGDGNAVGNFEATNDITAVTTVGLALGPLTNNGGSTQTHALLAGSVAIDRMTGTPVWDQTADQRGVARPVGVAKDSGAYEAAVVCGASMNVATFADLNEAVVCFNAETAAGVYTISVNADITYTATLTSITNSTAGVSLDIAGNGNTLDAAANGRVLTNFNSTLSVDNLTITGGNTGSGGGIFNGSGTVTVSNTTITDNTASTGGGIDNSAGTLTVSNSTVSGNTATQSGGGIYNNLGTVNVWFSTVTGNTAPDGAGLWSFNETFAFTNVGGSIVADNLGAGGDVDYRFGTGTNSFISDGFNVIGDGNATGNFEATNDITAVTTAALTLGPLTNNGGSTQTHALLAGSVAIDRMTGTPVWDEATDQRGIARPIGIAKDSGAYEADPCNTTVWNVATFTGLNDAVVCFNAQTAAGVYTINVNADITYTGVLTTISNTTAGISLDIAGNGNTLNAAAVGRVLDNFNSIVSVDNLTITGGNIDFDVGGGIFNFGGTVTVTNSTITDNTASTGGGIFNTGTTTVSNSTVSGNTATQSGGGIYNNLGTVNVWFSTVTGNTAPDGAGLWSFNETFAFTNVGGSIVADNLGVGGDVDYQFGTGTNSFSSDGFNVIGDGNAVGSFAATDDIIAVTTAALALGPLAGNGGSTQTHALLAGSVAIDRMTGTPVWDEATDQRGIARPIGIAKDSGAFEGALAQQITVLAAPCVIYDSPTATGPGLGGTFNGGELRTVTAAGALTGQGGAASCVPGGASGVVVTISAIGPQAGGNLRLSEAGVVPNGGVVNYANNGLNNANTVTVPLSATGQLDVFANGGPGGVGLPSTDVHLAVVAYYSPTGTLTYNPVTPCAVADSRTNQNPTGAFIGPFSAGAPYPDVDVAGTFSSSQGGGQTDCGIPTDATAVLVNIVAVNTTGGTGYLATGTGGTTPVEPTTPFAALGMNNATTSIIALDAAGTIAVDIQALSGTPATHVRIVVLGYYAPTTGSDYTPLNPCAAFDTRPAQNPTGVFLGERDGGQTTTYQITGPIPSAQGGNGGNCGVPTGATAVQINIVAVNATEPGNLQAFATGTTPTGGILNFAPLTPAMNNANTITIPLSALGQLDIFTNTGPTNLPNATHIRGIILGYHN